MNQQQFTRQQYQPFGQGGTFYNQQQKPTAKMTNPLTPEQMAAMQNNGSKFTIDVTEDEFNRGICTHKKNMDFATSRVGPDGSELYCHICGEKWSLIYGTDAEIQEAVDLIVNILQTIKTVYLDIPENVARQFFQIIPLIKKIPAMYKIGMSNIDKYEPNQVPTSNNNMNAMNALGAITMSGGFSNQPFNNNFQQPYGNQQFQQPYGNQQFQQQGYGNQQFQQQPYTNQQFQQQQGYDNNPFGYGQPQSQQNQQQQNFQQSQQNQQQNQQPSQSKTVISATKILEV